MKRREGLVSNSSSSSFVIFHKGTKSELKKELEKIFMLPESYPIKNIGFSDCVFNLIEDVIKTEEQYIKYRDESGFDDVDEKELALLKDGFTMYYGSFSTENGGVEELLSENSCEYRSENLIILGDSR